MYFGKNIKYLRTMRGLTQKDLGTRFGVEPTTVGGWEKEDSYPYFKVLLSMRELFEIDLESLVYRDLEKDGVATVNEGNADYIPADQPQMDALWKEIEMLQSQLDRSKVMEKKLELLEARMDLLEKQGDAVVGELGKIRGK